MASGGSLNAYGTEANENTAQCALSLSGTAVVNSMAAHWENTSVSGTALCFPANGGTVSMANTLVNGSAHIGIDSQTHTGNVINDLGGNTVTGTVTGYIGTWNYSNRGGVPASLTNCSSSASPAVCNTAASGSVVIAAAATTVTVNTTSVTANSQILLTEDSSLGTKLTVTCNTTTGRTYTVTARTAGTSFIITASAAPTTNPACLSYTILN